MYYRNLLEVWWSFLFERKVEKVDQTTILAVLKELSPEPFISPDGKFLYASNRGEANTISTFRILKTEN
jgi:6-phosphogluconolactonase